MREGMRDVAHEEHGASIAARALVAAEQFSDGTAIIEGNTRVSYAEFGLEVIRSTRAAITAGIRPGDRAAIWAPNGYRWIIAALGILGAGGVLVPVNTRFKGGEAAYVLRRTHAQTLFTVSGFLGTDYPAMLRDWLAEAGEELPDLRAVVLLDGQSPAPATSWESYLSAGEQGTVSEAAARAQIGQVSGDDVADIMFTSGTTGRPKGAVGTHAQILRLFWDWAEVVGLREADRFLIVSPFFHTFGYKAGWLACILKGATAIPVPVFDPAGLAQTVEQERVTFLPGPPTMLQELLRLPDRNRYDLSSLRTTVTGAADVPVELIKRLRSEMSFQTIITGYGLTETNGVVSMCREGDDPETIARFCGVAMPGSEVRIAAPDGTEVPRGELGEIIVRGYQVTSGYLDDPEATAAAIDPGGWLHTGDIGVMDERGYIKVTGRIKDMYIVGGFNAYPAEIEDLLLGNSNISQVAVVGVPDERLGEVGAAFVVPRTGADLAPGDVIEWARPRMANYKVPRYVEIRDDLPTNAVGKIMKDTLRASFRQQEPT